MTEFTLELNRRRVLAGILVIGLAAAAAGVGTFALFSDTATTDGDISAGELSVDPVNSSFSVSNLYPTQTTETQNVSVEYTSGINANLNVTLSAENDTQNFASALVVESANLTIGSTDHDLGIEDSTLSDINESTQPISEEDGVLTNGEEATLELTFTFDDTRYAGDDVNDLQGESVDVEVTFEAEQISES